MTLAEEGKAFLEQTARALVDDQSSLRVVVTNDNEGAQTVLFSLSCAKDDIGKIIGKAGRTANSIRNILNSIAAKHKKRAVLDIQG